MKTLTAWGLAIGALLVLSAIVLGMSGGAGVVAALLGVMGAMALASSAIIQTY